MILPFLLQGICTHTQKGKKFLLRALNGSKGSEKFFISYTYPLRFSILDIILTTSASLGTEGLLLRKPLQFKESNSNFRAQRTIWLKNYCHGQQLFKHCEISGRKVSVWYHVKNRSFSSLCLMSFN